VIFGDEQAPAGRGVLPDADDPGHDQPRKLALWGNLMGGGAGVEWYFGHRFPHMDIDCEDWRSRDKMWDQTRYALQFFHTHLPFTEMAPANALTSNTQDYCLAKPGEIYAIYLPEGGTTELELETGKYRIDWYDPHKGGELQRGSVSEVSGPGLCSIGEAPVDKDLDWAVLVRSIKE
jgi:hypothetical protein